MPNYSHDKCFTLSFHFISRFHLTSVKQLDRMPGFLFTLVNWVHCLFNLYNEGIKLMRKSRPVSRPCTRVHEDIGGYMGSFCCPFCQGEQKAYISKIIREKCSTLHVEMQTITILNLKFTAISTVHSFLLFPL